MKMCKKFWNTMKNKQMLPHAITVFQISNQDYFTFINFGQSKTVAADKGIEITLLDGDDITWTYSEATMVTEEW